MVKSLSIGPVLEAMRRRGILVDREKLKVKSEKLRKEIRKLAAEIKKLAGEDFNLNSPRQLSRILFEKLKLVKGGRRTKTGLRSTSEAALDNLRGSHRIIDKILQYREQFKLLSTYLEPWLKYSRASRDGRIHPTFLQDATATGRLTCQNPNLQNVPSQLREVLVAAAGHTLISVDYSQIELRVLATVTKDPALLEAFAKDLDIHQLTASKVFNVPLEKVTKEQRNLAKTLNFGVIYGMGAAAFARVSGLSRKEAEQFIEEYFLEFKKVRQWQEKVKWELQQNGYVENLEGQRRELGPGEERAAINFPIQSLAAHIIKLAMIKTAKYPLLLSIHDQLVFEIEKGKIKGSSAAIKEIMESVYKLAVPLKVNVTLGSW
mgnify:CR=1 FL=1